MKKNIKLEGKEISSPVIMRRYHDLLECGGEEYAKEEITKDFQNIKEAWRATGSTSFCLTYLRHRGYDYDNAFVLEMLDLLN